MSHTHRGYIYGSLTPAIYYAITIAIFYEMNMNGPEI